VTDPDLYLGEQETAPPAYQDARRVRRLGALLMVAGVLILAAIAFTGWFTA
jgi:hypothetical protein